MKRFGEKEEVSGWWKSRWIHRPNKNFQLDAMLANHTLKTIADVWCDMDEEERDK